MSQEQVLGAALDVLARLQSEAVGLLDAEGRILYANAAARELLDSDQNQVPSQLAEALRLRQRRTVIHRLGGDRTAVLTLEPLDGRGFAGLAALTGRETTELDRLQRAADGRTARVARMPDQWQSTLPQIVAASAAMEEVLELAARVSEVDTTVLLLGESGVGKEVVARYLHHLSPRMGKPFVKINCGAIPENLLESELFGYEAGAFTGARRQGKPGLVEIADGGTLFLDEVTELPTHLQVKLLHFLQDRTATRVGAVYPYAVNVRVVSATNREVAPEVQKGRLREDLYYRLNVVPITIPPLRERVEDIEPLAQHFLQRYTQRYRRSRRFSPAALAALRRHRWPGNVRELENAMERAVVISRAEEIAPDDLPLAPGAERPRPEVQVREDLAPVMVRAVVPLREAVRSLESQLVTRAAAEFGSSGKVGMALGVDQSTALRKMRKYLKHTGNLR